MPANRPPIYTNDGSAEYWLQHEEAFRLIRQAKRAAKNLEDAPQYLHGGYDEDGDVIPIENIEPYEAFDEAINALEANPVAVWILAAQRCFQIGDQPLLSVIACAKAHDPEATGPDTD